MFVWDDKILKLLYESMYLENKVYTDIKALPSIKPYGFWISSDADKFIVVPFQGHTRVAGEIISKNKKSFDGSEFFESDSYYDIMYYNGWGRIVCYSTKMYFDRIKIEKTMAGMREVKIKQPNGYSKITTIPPTPKQLSWMKFVCSLYDLKSILNGLDDSILWVSPEYGGN
jgi:hypothetical protein